MPAINAQDLLLGVGALVGALLVVGLGVLSSRRNSARESGLKAWATRRGWQYLPQRDELAGLLPGVAFGKGSRRRCRNLVRGTLGGLPLTAFDYSYAVASSKPGPDDTPASSSTTFRLRVLLVELPERWPRLSASPHGLLSRLAVTLGGQDVVTGQEPFDQQYRVKAEDQAAARRLLEPLGPALLADQDQALELDENLLVLYRPGLQQPEDLQTWLAGLDGPVARLASIAQPDRDGTDG
jgi:hypothetical protein